MGKYIEKDTGARTDTMTPHALLNQRGFTCVLEFHNQEVSEIRIDMAQPTHGCEN